MWEKLPEKVVDFNSGLGLKNSQIAPQQQYSKNHKIIPPMKL